MGYIKSEFIENCEITPNQYSMKEFSFHISLIFIIFYFCNRFSSIFPLLFSLIMLAIQTASPLRIAWELEIKMSRQTSTRIFKYYYKWINFFVNCKGITIYIFYFTLAEIFLVIYCLTFNLKKKFVYHHRCS